MAWAPLERAPLAELLAERRSAVDGLRAALQKPEGGAAGEGGAAVCPLPGFADDVWLLRYTISFEDTASAAAAARKALAWRRENGPLIEAARRRRAPDDFTAVELRAIELFLTSAYQHTSRFGDPVFVSRMRGCNLRALMDAVSEAKLERWLNFVNECAWQYCEAASKGAGAFVKQINIQDVAATAMVQEMRFFRALGSSSKTNEWLRPQFIGKTYSNILNPPAWVKFASRLAGSVMSPQAIAKIFVHPGSVPGRAPAGVDGARLCRFAREFLGDPARVPSFVGGTCDSDLVFPVSARQESAPEGDELRREPRVLAGLPRPLEAQQADPEGPDDNASSTSFKSCRSFATAEDRSPRWPPAAPVPLSMDGGSVAGRGSGRRCCLLRVCRRLICGRRRRRRSGVVMGAAAPERLLDP
ncbi:unnamed protein product [Prorocentrum cordatum]|uniref:CRAL-TRIO domain-containing protein n=2 Tax=Prorocentrum cordatum TaxID=2364126 RepID=A0ABN9VVS5_9DINO|nr:unnamed protein product [Polarella glacialis]